MQEMRSALEAEEDEANFLLAQEDTHEAALASDRIVISELRGAAE